MSENRYLIIENAENEEHPWGMSHEMFRRECKRLTGKEFEPSEHTTIYKCAVKYHPTNPLLRALVVTEDALIDFPVALVSSLKDDQYMIDNGWCENPVTEI